MINVKEKPYYAKGDGTSDDHDAIQRALKDAQNVEEVYLPAGTYMISKKLSINSNKLRGERFARVSDGGTIIKAMQGFSDSEVIYTKNHPCQMLDFNIDGNNMVNYGLHAYKCNGASTLFSNLAAFNTNEYGFYFEGCQSTTVERLLAQNNDIGICAENCNATRFIHCVTSKNTRHGMKAKRSGSPSSGCRIINLITEENGGHGLTVQGVKGIVIEKCWIEGNGGDGMELRRCRNGMVEGTRISGGFNIDDRCIRLYESAMCRVFNCTAAHNTKGHLGFINIRDENGVSNELSQHNYRLSDLTIERLPVEPISLP